YHLACRRGGAVVRHRLLATAHQPAVTGRTRPVLIRPQGPFFRRLPGDSRIIAASGEAYTVAQVFRTAQPPVSLIFGPNGAGASHPPRRRARRRGRVTRPRRAAPAAPARHPRAA